MTATARVQPEWRPTHLGPLTLPAPHRAPRQLEGAHGHLWQWVGTGEPLLSLSAAVRETRLGTPGGVRGHLGWEVEQVRASLDDAEQARVQRDVPLLVEGARGVAAATVDGTRDGLGVRNAVVVTTDGTWMHVVRVAVVDDDAGHRLVSSVLDDLVVHAWSPPR